jgi:hypothetical protein
MPPLQPKQPGQFSGHETRVDACREIVPGHLAAKGKQHDTQEMRESRPPRFAKADGLVSLKHPTDRDQIFIGKMVQNENTHEHLAGTTRKFIGQVALSPEDRPRQLGRPRRKIQPGQQRARKPTQNFPAQTAISGANFNKVNPMAVGCELYRRVPLDGAIQRPPDPACVAHQGVNYQQVEPAPQGGRIIGG